MHKRAIRTETKEALLFKLILRLSGWRPQMIYYWFSGHLTFFSLLAMYSLNLCILYFDGISLWYTVLCSLVSESFEMESQIVVLFWCMHQQSFTVFYNNIILFGIIIAHCKNGVVNITTNFGDVHYLSPSLACGDILSWWCSPQFSRLLVMFTRG